MTGPEDRDVLLPAMREAAENVEIRLVFVKALDLFAWMAPGEVRTFGLDGLDEAQAWAAG